MQNRHPRPEWLLHAAPTHCPYRTWLIDRGSLTRRIQSLCANFNLRGLRTWRGKADRDEAACVNLEFHIIALLREVHLYCGDTPVVFAHSIIPKKGMNGPWHHLGKLGNKPLGAALFANPLVRRMPLQFRKLDRRHALYRRACAILSEPPLHLWARRSVFILQKYPILVTEVFLPGILELHP
ncbi:MAG: chorismate lyase [Sulfuricellaceae bacterium]|nr:chorismate lyase [Sulfuricellaceae bacterium]